MTGFSHSDAMIGRRQDDPQDPHPECGGLLSWVNRGHWDDQNWEVYICTRCGTRLATVGGGRHWQNHVFPNASARRLADAE
jgi:hypothetical protein